MTLEEALQNLEAEILFEPLPHEQDFNDALKVLIEAGKEVICLRSSDRTLVRPLLPGETQE